jgi:nicotinamidase-related amidase
MAPGQLSRATAVFLLVDHQTGVFERVVQAPRREQVGRNVIRLARAAAILDIPAIFTTSEEEGENGPLLAALEQIPPDAHASRVDRHGLIDTGGHHGDHHRVSQRRARRRLPQPRPDHAWVTQTDRR